MNSTEETTTESYEQTERPIRPQQPSRGTSFNENCNASTPPMRVFPQEIHHHHHHYLPTIQNGCQMPYNVHSGTNFNYAQPNTQDSASIQQLVTQMRQFMAALENMKLRVTTLSDVVDELINSNTNTKLLLTGAKVEATTNLFELVRHVVLDKLELKDLKNDIYSATRTKNGIVFDVASGLDKRRILARARERFKDDEELRIQDYYDGETKSTDGSSESIIDVRFGED